MPANFLAESPTQKKGQNVPLIVLLKRRVVNDFLSFNDHSLGHGKRQLYIGVKPLRELYETFQPGFHVATRQCLEFLLGELRNKLNVAAL